MVINVIPPHFTHPASSATGLRQMRDETKYMPNTVRTRPLSEGLDTATVRLFVEASADPLIVDATYLPPGLSSGDVVAWASRQARYAWVLYLDDEPVGFYKLTPPLSTCGIEVPDRTLEREVWLTAPARGRGVIRVATELLCAQLIGEGVENIAAVVWESNTAAISGARNAGFKALGRGWWEQPGYEGGWCEVWILGLKAVTASCQ